MPLDARPIVRPLVVLAFAAMLVVGACTSPASSATPSDQMMEHSATPS